MTDLTPESTSKPGGLVCAHCGRSDGTFEAWGSVVTHSPCVPQCGARSPSDWHSVYHCTLPIDHGGDEHACRMTIGQGSYATERWPVDRPTRSP